jgi:hypothetical protein
LLAIASSSHPLIAMSYEDIPASALAELDEYKDHAIPDEVGRAAIRHTGIRTPARLSAAAF